MTLVKTVWFLWWGWNPDKVEIMLEEMEQQGWNLYQIDMWGIRFRFKKGESQKVRYCVDFQPNLEDHYIKLLNDDGWDLTWNDSTGWYIWKKHYSEERPSIYTDLNSLIERNNRLIKVLTPVIIALIPVFIFLLTTRLGDNTYRYLFGLYLGVFIMYGVIFYQIKSFNKRLKENSIKE